MKIVEIFSSENEDSVKMLTSNKRKSFSTTPILASLYDLARAADLLPPDMWCGRGADHHAFKELALWD